MPVRCTIVGCGAVAQTLYLPALKKLSQQRVLEVDALVDPNNRNLQKIASYFPNATHFADIEHIVDIKEGSLVLLLSPAHLHAFQAGVVMNRGCHVLCEKPMAFTGGEAEAMNEIASRNDRILAVGMVRRFFPAFRTAVDLVARDLIGQIRKFSYHEGGRFTWDIKSDAPFRPVEAGGTGVLFDIGPHAIDLLLAMLPDLQVRQVWSDRKDGVSANVTAELANASAAGLISISWNSPQRNRLHLEGSKGQIVLALDRFNRVAIDTGSGLQPLRREQMHRFPTDINPKPKKYQQPASYDEAVRCQVVQTIRAILLNEKPAVSSVDAIDTVKLLQDIHMFHSSMLPWVASEP